MRRRFGAAVLVLALAVGLAGCTPAQPEQTFEEKTRAKAAELARADVATVSDYWMASIRRSLQAGDSRAKASAAGQKGAAGATVAHLTLLQRSATTATLRQDVAVAYTLSDASGLESASANVRVCARFSSADGTAVDIANLTCPAELPDDVPGVGTIDAEVPYRP